MKKYFVKYYIYDLDSPKNGWGSKREIRTEIIEGETPEQILKDLERKIFDGYLGLDYVEDIHNIN